MIGYISFCDLGQNKLLKAQSKRSSQSTVILDEHGVEDSVNALEISYQESQIRSERKDICCGSVYCVFFLVTHFLKEKIIRR